MISTKSLTLVALSLNVILVASQGTIPVKFMSDRPELIASGIQACISSTGNFDGAKAVLHNCNTEPAANFSVTNFNTGTAPQQIVTFGNKCLDVTGGVNANGVKLQWWTCGTNNPNQQWVFTEGFTSSLQWSGTNKCVDITDGKTTDGTLLQLWECSANDVNQQWDAASVGFNTIGPVEIQGPFNLNGNGPQSPPGGPFCIIAQSSTNGSPVSLVPCANAHTLFPTGNTTFIVPVPSLAGPMKTFSDTKCLDVPNGSTTNGNKLQIWDCVDGNTNQLFINAQARISWANKGKCLDLTNGNFTAGTPIQIWDCIDGSSNQNWEFAQLS